MIEMIVRYLRQKLGNLGIVLVLLAMMGLTLMTFVTGRGGPATLALLLIAPGAVSRDISSGTAQMILARPIRRSEYLLGRYLGILLLYAAFLVLAVLLTLALRPIFSGAFDAAPIPTGHLLGVAAGEWLDGALLAATLLFLSTFLPGFGDLLAYFMLQIGLGVAGSLQQYFPAVAKAANVARENVFPQVAWSDVLGGDGALGAATGRFVLALATFLVGALFVFSRREFSYGHD